MYKKIDSVIPYLLWKISINNVKQSIHYPLNYWNIIHDIKNEKYIIDNFGEVNCFVRTSIYFDYLKILVEKKIITEMRIRIQEYKPYYTDQKFNEIILNDVLLKEYPYQFRRIDLEESDNEKNYRDFIEWKYTQYDILKNIWQPNIYKRYEIYYIFKIDKEKLHNALNTYIDNWGNGVLTPSTQNYIKPIRQIEHFKNILISNYNDIGKLISYFLSKDMKYDEFTLIQYFEKKKYIKIKNYNNPIEVIYRWLSSVNIEILDKFIEEFIHKEWISFDENSWKVYIDGKKVWTLSINTQPFYFFKFLFDNKSVYKTHVEIKEYIKPKDKIGKTEANFCAEIKRGIPLEIRNIIKTQKWWYLIP